MLGNLAQVIGAARPIWHRVPVTRMTPWDEEQAAGDLYVELNGGTWELVDELTAPDSTYDIKVTLPTGRTIAVEVSQDTTEAIRHQRAIEAQLDWASDRLDAWWDVSVKEPCDIRALHAVIFDIIAEFAAAGRRSLIIGRSESPSEIHDRLRDLGVTLLHRFKDADPGYVNLSPASEVGFTGPSALVEVAEDHANRPDNAKKLNIAATDERHLWIWVTDDRGEQMAAALGGHVPHAGPSVPDYVDAIWIATAHTTPTLWRWDRQRGWDRQSPAGQGVTG
jgi:hypothetical protein